MSANDLQKALGPLEPLFADPEVSEVMVDGPERITVEKRGRIENTNVRFESNEGIESAIKAVLHAVGVEMEDNKTMYRSA